MSTKTKLTKSMTPPTSIMNSIADCAFKPFTLIIKK